MTLQNRSFLRVKILSRHTWAFGCHESSGHFHLEEFLRLCYFVCMLFFLSLIGERVQFIYCILILNLEWSAISSWSELDLVFFEKKQWQCCVLSPWIQEGSVPGQSTSLLRVLIVSIWFCCWLTASSSWHATFVLSSLVITYSREILCEYTWIAISDQMFNQHWPTLKVLVWIIHFCDSLRDWSQFPSFFCIYWY